MPKIDDAFERFGNLLGFVRLVLLIDWDPIGILGHPRAMDEYDSYARGICAALQLGATREDLIEHLRRLEKVHLCLSRVRPVQGAVADKLLLIYKVIQENAEPSDS